MYKNHHAQRLASLKREAEQKASNIQHLQAEIDWFDSFDQETNHSRLAKVQRDGQVLREQLAQVEAGLSAARSELTQARGTAEAGWSPLHWFSSERSVAKRQVDTVEVRLRQLEQRRKGLASGLDDSERLELRLLADLQRYRAFDSLQARSTIVLMLSLIHI